MTRVTVSIISILVLLFAIPSLSINAEPTPSVSRQPLEVAPTSDAAEETPGAGLEHEAIGQGIPDPLEPINRVFFYLNDKFYFWLRKPFNNGYWPIVPRLTTVGLSNFFYNLAFPIRFVYYRLQTKLEGAGLEYARFLVNRIVGMAGLHELVWKDYEFDNYEQKLGQTLGTYGFGPAFYIHWPIFGPSSLRDTLSSLGEGFVDFVNPFAFRSTYNAFVKACNGVKKSSQSICDYEDLKSYALDPYVAVRDAYYQYCQSKIDE